MAYTNFTNCTKEQYESIIYSEEDTNRIRIWFNNVELQDADEYCESLSGTNRILPNDGNKVFTLDNFIAKEYQLILRDLPASTIIADQVKISIGTLVDETNSIYEDVPIGIFNIQDTPTRDNGKITIKLRDNRVKFDFNYNAQPLIESLGGTATKKQILEDICNQAGVINNVLVFDGQDDEVGIYDNTITATTYVSYIFEQAGLMPTINRNGELDKIDFNNLKVWRIPLSIVENYELGTPFEVQRVVYESGVVKYESSSEESLQTLYLDASNPYITNEEQIENIYNMLNCFSIDSVKTGKILGNPAIDPFDMIIIYDDEINDNPTTNSTGSTISLENTPNAPMKIVLKPQTLSQDTTTGKNLLGLTNVSSTTTYGITYSVNNNVITLSGTANNTGSTAVLIDIALLTTMPTSLGTLTKSLNRSGTYTGVQTSLRGSNPNSSAGLWSNNGENNVGNTLTQDAYYFRIQINNNVSVNCTLKAQVETGSSVSSFEPYTYGASPNPEYPQQIHTISGDNTINVLGKNLFDYTTTEFSSNKVNITTENNTIIMTTNVETTSGNLFFMTKIPDECLENGVSYTISSENVSGVAQSLKLQLRNHDGSNANKSRADTIVYDSNYSLFVDGNIYSTNNSETIPTGTTAIIKNVQVEKGTATTYEPYIGNSYEVNLGKNLIPNNATTTTTNGITFTANTDGTISVSGTATATAYLTNPTFSLNAGTYTLSAGVYVNTLTRIQLVEDITGRPLLVSTENASSKTFTITATKNVFLQFRINSGEVINTTFYPQLEKGTKDTSYSKYFTPIELCKIGNYQDRLFKASGKNLFDESKAQIGKAWNNTSNTARAIVLTRVQPNTKYTISFNSLSGLDGIYWFDRVNENDSTYITGNTQITQTTTITTASTCNWLGIQFNKSNITQNDINNVRIMLEKSSSATSYEPYGNYWYKYKAIGKVVLDGSESWITWNDVSTGNTRLFGTNNYDGIKKNGYIGICNYFINSTTTLWNADTQGMQINATGSHTIRFRINKTLANDLTTFKTWLSTNNTIVYYVLATPTYTKIDNEELIEQLNKVKNSQSQDGQTNISQVNNDLPFILNVESFNESYILRTLANNTYTYNGVNRNQFDTQIGLEQRTENVSINSEAILKKWAKTNIDNLQGQITLSAGDINDLEGRVNQTELDISSQSAKIEVLSTNIDEETGNVLGVKTTSYELGSNGFIIDDGTGYKSIDNTTGKYFYDNNSMVGKYTKDGSVQKNLALFGKYYYGVDENVNVETFSKEKAMFIAQVYTGQDMQGNDETGFGHFYNGD